MDNYVETSSRNVHQVMLFTSVLAEYISDEASKLRSLVLTTLCQHNADFSGFAIMTIQAAGNLYAHASKVRKALRKSGCM